MPSQASTNGPGDVFWFCPVTASVAPVAQHWWASRQVTLVRRLPGVVGFGLGTVVHEVPSQESTSVVEGFPLASIVAPTVQQSDELEQSTAER